MFELIQTYLPSLFDSGYNASREYGIGSTGPDNYLERPGTFDQSI